MAAAARRLNLGIFGGGVVGGGVIELIQRGTRSGRFAALGLPQLTVKAVCVKDPSKPRDYSLPEGARYVTSYDDILCDEEIDVVVELMGGTTAAKDVVFRAIAAGKHIITANKALIAQYLPELQDMLRENPTVSFRYEAAVCGGIPVINSLQGDFLADNITKVQGIMNGTTNYILSSMEKGLGYAEVLKQAQELGFAEADPTADVEGHDVQAKIAILAKLAFGKTVPFAAVPTMGISRLTAEDFQFAKQLGGTIKLIGTAQRNEDQSLSVFVSPNIVPWSNPLSTAKGPGNMVLVSSENLSLTTLAGPGAGRFPTANSVMSDLIRLARGVPSPAFPLEAQAELQPNPSSKFYLRVRVATGAAVTADGIKGIASSAGVSLDVVPVDSNLSSGAVDHLFLTGQDSSLAQMHQLASALLADRQAVTDVVFMPMLA